MTRFRTLYPLLKTGEDREEVIGTQKVISRISALFCVVNSS